MHRKLTFPAFQYGSNIQFNDEGGLSASPAASSSATTSAGTAGPAPALPTGTLKSLAVGATSKMPPPPAPVPTRVTHSLPVSAPAPPVSLPTDAVKSVASGAGISFFAESQSHTHTRHHQSETQTESSTATDSMTTSESTSAMTFASTSESAKIPGTFVTAIAKGNGKISVAPAGLNNLVPPPPAAPSVPAPSGLPTSAVTNATSHLPAPAPSSPPA